MGRVLGIGLLAENRQEALIQLLADRAFQWSLNAGEIIQRVVERDSPSWSPRFIDHLVGDRIHRELMDFTDKVRRNPDHELRRSATRFLFEFADDLQHDPDTIARADAVKEQLMARDEIANAAATAWRTLKRLVLEGVDDPSSTLRTRITDTVVRARGIAARRRRPARQGSTTGWCGRPSIWSRSMGWRSQRSSPRRSRRWDAEEAQSADRTATWVVTCNLFGSTAPWWARWRGWRFYAARAAVLVGAASYRLAKCKHFSVG